jgi:hypothetical protein
LNVLENVPSQNGLQIESILENILEKGTVVAQKLIEMKKATDGIKEIGQDLIKSVKAQAESSLLLSMHVTDRALQTHLQSLASSLTQALPALLSEAKLYFSGQSEQWPAWTVVQAENEALVAVARSLHLRENVLASSALEVSEACADSLNDGHSLDPEQTKLLDIAQSIAHEMVFILETLTFTF